MRCETKMWGRSCTGKAAYVVEGLIITKHLTCKCCARMWKATHTEVLPISVTPIESADKE